jgi:hypothetical protein
MLWGIKLFVFREPIKKFSLVDGVIPGYRNLRKDSERQWQREEALEQKVDGRRRLHEGLHVGVPDHLLGGEEVTGLVVGAQEQLRRRARRAPQEQLRRRARRGRFPFSSCFSPSFPYSSSFSSVDGIAGAGGWRQARGGGRGLAHVGCGCRWMCVCEYWMCVWASGSNGSLVTASGPLSVFVLRLG